MDTEVMKIKVISLNIKIGKTEVEMSMEDAQRLFLELKDIFGQSSQWPIIINPVIYREIPYYPNYPTTQPWVTWSISDNTTITGEVLG